MPVTKSICINTSGDIYLRDYFIVRRVLDRARAEYFERWDFATTGWSHHTLDGPIHVSNMPGYHTVLLRMVGVRRCPLFALKLLDATSPNSRFGPTLPTPPSAPPLSAKALGKQRARD